MKLFSLFIVQLNSRPAAFELKLSESGGEDDD